MFSQLDLVPLFTSQMTSTFLSLGFSLLSLSVITAVKVQRQKPVFLTAENTICFNNVMFPGVFVIL